MNALRTVSFNQHHFPIFSHCNRSSTTFSHCNIFSHCNRSATFLTSLRTRILKINSCKYSICSVYLVKSLSFFRCETIFIIFPRKLIVTSLLSMPLLFIGLLPRSGFTDPVFTFLYFIDCRCFILIPRWLPTKRCNASNFKKAVAS